MDKYIECEAVFDVLFGQYCASCDETEQALNAAIEEIKSIPAADVVPVVRCRDCKHRDPEDKKCDCGGLEHAHMFPVADDWFCADGEKREVEHD